MGGERDPGLDTGPGGRRWWCLRTRWSASRRGRRLGEERRAPGKYCAAEPQQLIGTDISEGGGRRNQRTDGLGLELAKGRDRVVRQRQSRLGRHRVVHRIDLTGL